MNSIPEPTRGRSDGPRPGAFRRALTAVGNWLLMCHPAWWLCEDATATAQPTATASEPDRSAGVEAAGLTDAQVERVVRREFTRGLSQLERYLADVEAGH